MGFRLVVAAVAVVLVASTAGTAIAIGTGGFSGSAVDGDSDVAGQVVHYLSPDEIEQKVADETSSTADSSDATRSAATDAGQTDLVNRVAPPGSSEGFNGVVLPAERAPTDTSNDGYPDRLLEAAPPLSIHDPDPERKNVFVEVDYMEGCSPDPAIERTVEAFADAPVENPDGSTGIDLHAVVDDELPRVPLVTPGKTQLESTSARQYRERNFQHAGQGYHYVVFVHNAGPNAGFRHGGTADTIIVECGSGDTFMHELGHALGLDASIHGVDSDEVAFEEYPSTMNYDSPTNHFEFSTGNASDVDHDDWGHLEASLAARSPSTERLEGAHLDTDGMLAIGDSAPAPAENTTGNSTETGQGSSSGDGSDADDHNRDEERDSDSEQNGDERDVDGEQTDGDADGEQTDGDADGEQTDGDADSGEGSDGG